MYHYSILIIANNPRHTKILAPKQEGLRAGKVQVVEFSSHIPPSEHFYNTQIKAIKTAFEQCGDEVTLVHMQDQKKVLPYVDQKIKTFHNGMREFALVDFLRGLGINPKTNEAKYIETLEWT